MKRIGRKLKKLPIALTAAFMLLPLSSAAIVSASLERPTYTETKAVTYDNTVSFKETTVHADDSKLAHAVLQIHGKAGSTVRVTYRTYDITAIEGIDYVGASNTITFRFDVDETQTYDIAIRCIHDSSNRQLFTTRSIKTGAFGGRKFGVEIVSVEGGTRSTSYQCQCFTPYVHNERLWDVDDGEMTPGVICYYEMWRCWMEWDIDGGTKSLDGKKTWKSWEHDDLYFDSPSYAYEGLFASEGVASLYATVLIKSLDDSSIQSNSDIYVLMGNGEFMEKYKRSSSCPGLSLYFNHEPHTSGAYRLDGNAMKYLSRGINPYKKDSKLVDAEINYVSPDHRDLYFPVPYDGRWIGDYGSIYHSAFYKIEPYKGRYQFGFTVYNNNKEWDREVVDPLMAVRLVDDTAPTLIGQYARYDKGTNKIYLTLRFSEVVYPRKKYDLTINEINGASVNLSADYYDGAFSDTLTYVIDPATSAVPKRDITSIRYQVPNEDISDLACNYDAYGNTLNNYMQNTNANRYFTLLDGHINLSTPSIGFNPPSSTKSQNLYNVTIDLNSGRTLREFNEGTVYYSIDKNETIANPDDPSSYQYSHELSVEEDGSFEVTISGDSGKYYIHTLAVSPFGFKYHATSENFYLDSDAPTISLTQSGDLRKKNYVLRIADKGYGTSITDIVMDVKRKEKDGTTKLFSLPIMEKGVNDATLLSKGTLKYSHNDSEGYSQYTYRADVTSDINEFFDVLMGDEKRMDTEVSFSIVDSAGNKAESVSLQSIYDIRDSLSVNQVVDESYVDSSSRAKLGQTIYDRTDSGVSDGITYKIREEDTDLRQYIDATKDNENGVKFFAEVNGKTVYADSSDPYSIKLANLAPGRYAVTPGVSGTAPDSTSVELISDTYYFYVTAGYEDSTSNQVAAHGNLVLTNHVFQLSEVQYSFYNASSRAVESHNYGATRTNTGRYEGGSAYPTFSDVSEARKYLRYMEYQDLYLLKISDVVASTLNSGSGGVEYVKAAGETRIAQSGQLWIRYKRNTWTPGSGTSAWAFYYYGEGETSSGIDLNNGLSANLRNAVANAVNTILKAGSTVYLVDEDNLSATTHAPYLATSQMHVNPETVSQSKSGSTYVSDPRYDGDGSLYQNNVTINGTSLPLAGNMPLSISSSTRLFYKLYSAEDIDENWAEITPTSGTLLAKAFTAGQLDNAYTIREFDENGISDFSFYLDLSIPKINVTLNQGMPGESTVIYDGKDTATIAASSFMFNGFESGEVDPDAYVAIFTYPYRNLQKVLYADSIAGYTLSGGNYYVQVGDRSGNLVSYRVLTSDSKLEVNVQQNTAGTGIYVTVANRAEREIYSYHVYLNETLIDSEFKESKFFRQSGVYRVEVADIYNTEPVVKVLSFQAPTPDITWYYLNDSGSFSVYDPANPVKMTLAIDESMPKTTIVHSSTTLRMFLRSAYASDDIGFEVTGIPASDYSYNDLTGLLAINSLEPWSLRVWYTSSPDNDHTYLFQLDNSSPTIDASFVGTVYRPVVETDQDGNITKTASFDAIDFSKFNEGDALTLDTLAYTISADGLMNFSSGEIISGSHIVLRIRDTSGVSSITAMRDGEALEINPTDRGGYYELSLSGYGDYRVTASDNLGNRSTFAFRNIGNAIGDATLDGAKLEEDVTGYGHDEVVINTSYEGTFNLLLSSEEGKATYQFLFDGMVLTYGRYIYATEISVDDEGNEKVVPNAEYEQAVDFVLNASDPAFRFGAWNTVMEKDDYVLYASISSDYNVSYRLVCRKGSIEMEGLYSVGSKALPDRFAASLSKAVPSLELFTDNEAIDLSLEAELVYIAGVLTIGEDLSAQDIIDVSYAFNASVPTWQSFVSIYHDGNWLSSWRGEEDGFYQIVVTNRHQNKTAYRIAKIDTFRSMVKIRVLDGSEVSYTQNDGSTVYSNQSIELWIYSDSATFHVKNVGTGEIYDSEGYFDAGATILELTREGAYEVRVTGENGIFDDFSFEIQNDEDFIFRDEWITGYNTEALKASESYTSTKCTLHVGEGVVFIDMVRNDTEYIKIYDSITDTPQTDASYLENAIGKYGSGKYEVGFRNKFGDLVKKVVYFNDVPALNLVRKTTYNPDVFVPYDLNKAIEDGFYSNYVLGFTTTSTDYVFTINDVSYRLDEMKTIEFTNISGKGSFSYEVTFKDEYGNFIKFPAILHRDDVVIDSSKMKTVTRNTTLYTKDDVVVTFDEGLSATVSISGAAAVPYESGQTYYGDGFYSFVVEDISGNRASYAVTHKSSNHFSLISSTRDGVPIIGGAVLNNATVTFTPTDDSYIAYVVRNGELVPDYTSLRFYNTGHWEIMVQDQIGNQTYADFYIINNSLAKFTYEAPYEYEVTEVWRVSPDGNRELLSQKGAAIVLSDNGNYVVVVTSTKDNSSFNFTVTVDNTPPTAELVGAENGKATSRDVSLKGLKAGDVVKLYKDGTLISNTTVSSGTTFPSITSSGRYRIQITNVQGVTTEYNFVRRPIASATASIFIMAISALAVAGMGFGLIYHTKLKTDE